MLRSSRFHLYCCLAYTLFCVTWRFLAGPLVAWDNVHYHVYVAHAWWEGRLPEELFAAAGQGYLNPLPHLPFYLAYLAEGSRGFISLGMALLHSVNLWLLHFITCRLIPPSDQKHRALVVLGVFLGALSPGFLYEVGSSYADVVVSIPALGALLLLLRWRDAATQGRDVDWRALYAAGLLAGGAIGLKPSVLVFCVSLGGVFILFSSRRVLDVAWRAVLAGTIGLLLSAGAHAWMLWQAFGSPVFPLFNGFFRSPWYPSIDLVSERFRPADLEAALRFPLHMASGLKNTSFENVAADIRLAWLLLLVLGVMVVLLVQRFRVGKGDISPDGNRRNFWLLLALSVPAWINSSGNIRYAIEILLLLGPAVALVALRASRYRNFLGLLAILLPIFGQTVLNTTLNNLKNGLSSQEDWQSQWDSWQSDWFSLTIPPPLDRSPAYYLTLQAQAFASFSPLFPSGARFLNLIQFPPLPPDSPVLPIVLKQAHERGLPVRSLFEAYAPPSVNEVMPEHLDSQNAMLSEYGYRVRGDDCSFIEFGKENVPIPAGRLVLISCAIEAADRLPEAEIARRRLIDNRIDRWMRQCPDVFSPPISWSVQQSDTRMRSFPNTDVHIATTKNGELALIYWYADQSNMILERADGTPTISGCPPRPTR